VKTVIASRGAAAPQGNLLEAGTYMVRLVAGGQTLMSSVDILEDTWMHQQ